MRFAVRLGARATLTMAAWLSGGSVPFAVGQDSRPAAETSAKALVEMAEQVQKEVEELRGWKFKRPVKKDVYSEAQLRGYIEKKIFEEELGGGKLERLQALLRLVGLVPADCDLKKTMLDVLLNQVGGFYDPAKGAFYMLQRSDVDYGPLLSRVLVAHELTHALDDQYFELEKLIKSRELTEDWSIAVGSLVEGSATALMTRYLSRAMRSGYYDVTTLHEVVEKEMERSRAFLEAPPYFTTLMATYVCGMHFLTRNDIGRLADAESPGVGDNVLAAAKDPPTTSEQVLHPERYWDKATRDHPVLINDDDMERLLAAAGLRVVDKNTIGELLCAVLTTAADRTLDLVAASLPPYWTNEAATGWGGDRIYLLSGGAGTSGNNDNLRDAKGVWVTAWDTPDDRDEFVEEYEANRSSPGRTVFNLGQRAAVFLFGFSPAQADELRQRLTARPPGFTRNSKPWSAFEP